MAPRNPLTKLILKTSKIVGKSNNYLSAQDDVESVTSSVMSTGTLKRGVSRSYSTESSKSFRKEPRNVNFDLAQNQYFENSNIIIDEEDISLCWYSNEECQDMKRREKQLVKSITSSQQQSQAQQPRNRRLSLNRQSSDVNMGTPAYINALNNVYQACRQGHTSTQEQEDALRTQLALQGGHRTGLEAKIVAAADTKERRHAMVELIYHSMNCPGSALAQRDPRKAANALRKQCAEISRPARIFAVQVARARFHEEE